MPKYIDADALKEAFSIEGKDVCDDTDEFDTKWGANQELIEKVIDSAPAADVEPKRKTGRWDRAIFDGAPGYRPFSIFCSECLMLATTRSSYCPNCGAKMGKEEDDV